MSLSSGVRVLYQALDHAVDVMRFEGEEILGVGGGRGELHGRSASRLDQDEVVPIEK